MSKVRTTVALSQISHDWLKQRAPSTGEMAEYLDSLIQKERTLGPIETRLRRQAEAIDRIIHQAREGGQYAA
jgi:hypothetical protein